MVCQQCGVEMTKVGVLTDKEKDDLAYVNEKFNCAQMALSGGVIKDIKFDDNQVFEYFKASYDQLAEANFLRYVFNRDLKKRLGVEDIDNNLFIDFVTGEVFQHPNVEHKEEQAEK